MGKYFERVHQQFRGAQVQKFVDEPSDVLIVEDNSSGHRLYYVRLLVQAAVARKQRVTVALAPGIPETEEFDLHLRKLTGKASFRVQEGFGYRDIANLANELSAKHVVVPDGDRFALRAGTSAGWPSRSTLTALVMRGDQQNKRFSARLKSTLRKSLFTLADKKPRISIFLLRPANAAPLAEFRSVPDPVTFEATPASIGHIVDSYDLTQDRVWFGIVGSITIRKNLDLVARALLSLKTVSVGLIVAGKQDHQAQVECARIAELLKGSGVSLIIVNRLVADAEIDSIIGAVDCIVLAHSNEGPSGILNKALAAGTPVVASGAQSLRREAEQWPSRIVWVPLEFGELVSAFSKQVKGRKFEPVLPDTGEFSSSLLAH